MNAKENDVIAIVGAGRFGTALAIAVAGGGRRVRLIGRDAAQAAAINATRHNPRALSDVPLPDGIVASAETDLADAALCLLATAAQATRAVLPDLRATLPLTVPLILCAKGLEAETGLRQSELARTVLPAQPLAALSGPGFADGIAAGLPTALALAAPSIEQAQAIARQLSNGAFRLYAQDDMAGVELGGALKNVLALAAGIVMGAGLGENARAALVTRGLAELARLGEAAGARASTFAGLAGLGDALLSCTSEQSRNYTTGLALGGGATLAAATGGRTVEGVPTVGAALRLAAAHRVALPITAVLDRFLNHGAPLPELLAALLARPLKAE